MLIKRFIGKGLHGHLNTNLRFLDDYNYLIGINGSGKTTVLNCIFALLEPRFDILGSLQFEKFSVSIKTKQLFTLNVVKEIDFIAISCPKRTKDVLKLDLVSLETSQKNIKSKKLGHKARFFCYDYLLNQRDNEVLKILMELPQPEYLALDGSRVPNNIGLRSRNDDLNSTTTSNPLLGISLNDVKESVKNEILECFRIMAENDNDFNKNVLNTLMGITPKADYLSIAQLEKNSDSEVLESIREQLDQLLGSKVIDSEQYTNLAGLIDSYAEDLNVLKTQNATDKFKKKLTAELSKKHQIIQNISKLSQISSKNIERRNAIFKRIDGFINHINGFLSDSNKRIDYNVQGELFYTIKGDQLTRKIEELSSGEFQLILLFAHIFLRPLQNLNKSEKSIFLIDEPELSLHIAWQAKFMDVLEDASDYFQLLIATHAPTIAVNQDDHCVDLFLKNRNLDVN